MTKPMIVPVILMVTPGYFPLDGGRDPVVNSAVNNPAQRARYDEDSCPFLARMTNRLHAQRFLFQILKLQPVAVYVRRQHNNSWKENQTQQNKNIATAGISKLCSQKSYTLI